MSFPRFHRVLCLLGLTAVFALPATLRAADDDHGDGEESPLHEAMEEMGRGLRVINRALNSADPAAGKASMLEAVQKMEQLAVEAKVLMPKSVEKLPEGERPAKFAEYRAELVIALLAMLELERAVLADDWEAAKAALAKVRESRKQGHEKFNPEE